MRRSRAMKMGMPKPPSMRERIASSAQSLARDVVEQHPMVKRLRNKVERRLKSAAGQAVRGLGGGR